MRAAAIGKVRWWILVARAPKTHQRRDFYGPGSRLAPAQPGRRVPAQREAPAVLHRHERADPPRMGTYDDPERRLSRAAQAPRARLVNDVANVATATATDRQPQPPVVEPTRVHAQLRPRRPRSRPLGIGQPDQAAEYTDIGGAVRSKRH